MVIRFLRREPQSFSGAIVAVDLLLAYQRFEFHKLYPMFAIRLFVSASSSLIKFLN
jgi:hypothetical protein